MNDIHLNETAGGLIQFYFHWNQLSSAIFLHHDFRHAVLWGECDEFSTLETYTCL